MIFIEGEVPWIGSVGKKRAGCLHLPAGTRHTKGKTLFPKQKPPGGCEEAQHEHTAHQVQFCWAPSHPRGNRAVRTPLCWAYPMQGWGQAPHQPWLSPISWYQPRGTSQNNRAGRSLHVACSRSSSRDAPQLCGPKCSKPPVFKMFFAGVGGEQVFFLPQSVLYTHDGQMNILDDTENQSFVLAKAVRIKLSD